MSAPQAQSSLYRPDIDGLRAVSVLAVVLFHTGVTCPGGYVGVDAFFVISGFLITNIIQNSLDRGDFSLTTFWARRVRRILPASLTMAFVLLLVGAFILLPYDLHELGEAAVAHAASLSNVYHWQQIGDYFGAESELRPLLHTWSLSVEEQFYLVYPLLLLSIRTFSPHRRTVILLLIATCSFAFSEIAVRYLPHAAFFMLPTRAWELLTGSLLSHWRAFPIESRLIRESLSWSGASLLLASIAFYSDGTSFPGFHALFPVVGTALMITASGSGQSWIGLLLSARPVVLIGLMSYSIYLWHWPLLLFGQYVYGSSLPYSIALAIVAVSIALSYFSWRYIELPFRSANTSDSPLSTIALGISASLIVGVASFYVVVCDGVPFRRLYSPAVFDDSGFYSSKYFRRTASSVPSDLPVIGEYDPSSVRRLLIWGDSHLPPIVEVSDELLKVRGLSGIVAARSSQAPIVEVSGPDSEASKWNNAVLDLTANGGFSDLIIVSRWSTWLNSEAAYAEVEKRLSYLCSKGVRVSVLKQVPEQRFHVSRAVYNSRLGRPIPEGVTRLDYQRRCGTSNRLLDRLAKIGVRALDPTPQFFDESGVCRVSDGRRSFYRDDDHLSSFGASLLLRPVLQAAIDDIADRPSLAGK